MLNRLPVIAKKPLSSPLTYIVIGVFAVYAVYSLSRAAQLLTAGYDLGIFDQAVRAYSRFEAPIVPLKGDDFNLLGDHFHPILMLLAPLYWIWDNARMLLLAQAALIALSCVFVWRVARRRFGLTVTTLLVVGYAIAWPLQGLVDFDFHEIAFAIPLLAWAIDSLDARRDVPLIVSCVLLLFVREDMGALVAVIGLIRAWRRPRLLGILMMIGGIGAFVVIIMLVIPAIRGGSYEYWDYSVLGENMSDAVRTIFTNPWPVIADFFSPFEKTATLIAFFLPLFLLPLLSPWTLVALPILAQRFLSDRSALWTSEFHYNAPVWIILFLAAVDGLGKLTRFGVFRHRSVPFIAATAIASVPILATTVFTSFAPQTYPLGRLVTGAAWVQTPHMADQRAALRVIPPSTCVAADDRLVPELTNTNRVTVPGISARMQDFYILDFSQFEPAHFAVGINTPTVDVYQRLINEGYTPIDRFGTLVVLQSPTYTGPTAACVR